MGDAIAARAREIIALTDDLMEIARSGSETLSGPLQLGVIPTISPFLLPRIMPRLRATWPKLQIYLHEDLTHRLLAALGEGRLDAVMLALPCESTSLDSVTLFDDIFSVACRRDHAFAKRQAVPIGALANEALLLLADGHCLRDHALAACGLSHQPDRDAFQATSLHTLVQMVENGLGITLLPQLALDAGILDGTHLVTRPLSGGDIAARGIGLAWRRGTRRAEDFRQLAATMAETALAGAIGGAATGGGVKTVGFR